MPKVCIIGDNCVDVYPETGKSYVGGNGINNAVAVKRNGIDTSYVGVIGNDKEGELVISTLKKENIDNCRVTTLKGLTAWTEVKNVNGDRVFVNESIGIQSNFDLNDADYQFAVSHDWVHHTVFSNWPTAFNGAIENYYQKMEEQIKKLKKMN